MVGVSERAQAQPRTGLRLGDIARLVVVWLASSVALAVAGALLPDLTAAAPWAYLVATAVAGLLGLAFRPVLVRVVARIGWLAVVLAGLVGQALLVYAAIWIAPGITATFWSAFWASWIVAGIGTAAAWLGSAGTDDSFTASLLRRRVASEPVADPEVDGVVFVQLDGVAFPVLRWAIQAGGVPTLRRWVTSGDYVLREWTAQLPCTTPASQLGILHGTVAGVPAFRWYDRELGRVLIANRPADAAVIEQRATNWGWVACRRRTRLGQPLHRRRASRHAHHEPPRRGTRVRGRPADVRLVPHQPQRLHPRCGADGRGNHEGAVAGRPTGHGSTSCHASTADGPTPVFAPPPTCCNATSTPRSSRRRCARGPRASTSTTSTTTRSPTMPVCSAPSPWRPLTAWIGSSERSSGSPDHAARRYHIVVLSDHGQSQGQTFRDRFGADLGEVCTRLMEEEVASLDAPVEEWGRVESLAEDLGGPGVYWQSRQPRRGREQATHRPKRRSRDHRRSLGARLRKSRHAVRALSRSGSPWRISRNAGPSSFPAFVPTRASDSSPASTLQVCRGPSVRTAASGSTPAR